MGVEKAFEVVTAVIQYSDQEVGADLPLIKYDLKANLK
jgi:hypothetical protein